MTQAGREHAMQCISLVHADALRIVPQKQTGCVACKNCDLSSKVTVHSKIIKGQNKLFFAGVEGARQTGA